MNRQAPLKNVIFARENFKDLYPEMLPLAEAQWREIAWNQDKIPLLVDEERYEFLQDEGVLLCFSVRHKGKLIGYALFIMNNHLHYKSTCFAVNDIVFLDKAYRGNQIGIDLLEFCESELKALGAKVITLHIKHMLDWSPMAKSLGFESVESTLLKWVGD